LTPAYLFGSCESVDYEKGIVAFKNGVTIHADLIIGADGIRVRACIFVANVDAELDNSQWSEGKSVSYLT